MKYAVSMQYDDVYKGAKRQLGLRISHLREQMGISQRQFALHLGLDRVTLNQIESGKGNPTLETLARIAWGLDKELSDLFRDDDDGPTHLRQYHR